MGYFCVLFVFIGFIPDSKEGPFMPYLIVIHLLLLFPSFTFCVYLFEDKDVGCGGFYRKFASVFLYTLLGGVITCPLFIVFLLFVEIPGFDNGISLFLLFVMLCLLMNVLLYYILLKKHSSDSIKVLIKKVLFMVLFSPFVLVKDFKKSISNIKIYNNVDLYVVSLWFLNIVAIFACCAFEVSVIRVISGLICLYVVFASLSLKSHFLTFKSTLDASIILLFSFINWNDLQNDRFLLPFVDDFLSAYLDLDIHFKTVYFEAVD